MSNKENNRDFIKRVNWFDGMKPENSEFTEEQQGFIDRSKYIVTDFSGSGVLQKNDIDQIKILDTTNPSTSNISYNILKSGNFDGQGIFVDRQPIDSVYGDQLLIELSNAQLNNITTKVIIFGKKYDPSSIEGIPILETLEFFNNGSKVTLNYFKSVIAVFFNNLSGGSGITAVNTTLQVSENTSISSDDISKITINEVDQLRVTDAALVLDNSYVPNIFIRDFITSSSTRSFLDELDSVVVNAQSVNYVSVSSSDITKLSLDFSGSTTKPMLDSTTSGFIFGQKFYLLTNNIQQISLSLALENSDTGNWSGELVVGCRKLQTKTQNQYADPLILDPDSTVIFESSVTQEELLDNGVVLNATSQEVKFNFINTQAASPSTLIEGNDYYIVTISRRGDLSNGTIVIDTGAKTSATSMFTTYNPSTKSWTDDSSTDIWMKIYSSAIRVTAGVAYTNDGTMVSIKKTTKSDDGSIVSFIAGPYSLNVVDSVASDNIVVLEHVDDYDVKSNSERTGNLVYLRIFDKATINIYNSSELTQLLAISNKIPLILAKINDINNRIDNAYTGTFTFPGQIMQDSALLINASVPSAVLSNVRNKILIPDITTPSIKYRINSVKQSEFYLGDFYGLNYFNNDDLNKELELVDKFSGQLVNVPFDIFDPRAIDILCYGNETTKNFVLGDINGDLIIDNDDVEILTDLSNTIPGNVSPAPTKVVFNELELSNIYNDGSPILITLSTAQDAYATASDEILFTAPLLDLRTMAIGDIIALSVDGFSTTTYENLIIDKIIYRNELVFTVEYVDLFTPIVEHSYLLSFFDYSPYREDVIVGAGNGASTIFTLYLPPNTIIDPGLAEIDGDVIISWTEGFVQRSHTFFSDGSNSGDATSGSIDRINGIVSITMVAPDIGTDILATYRLKPKATLRHGYVTKYEQISGNTVVEFRVPFILMPDDIVDISLSQFVVIQTDQGDPPTIVNTDGTNEIDGQITILDLPYLQMKVKVTDQDGNDPLLSLGNYYIRVDSGNPVNIPAIQDQFVTNILNIYDPITWQIQQYNFEWITDNMLISDLRRYLPVSLIDIQDQNDYIVNNDIWFPNNIILEHGEILIDESTPYHGDIEINKIILELPIESLLSNSINIYSVFVASSSENPGLTTAGYPAMKFSDGSFVGVNDDGYSTALTNNQVKITPSMHSLHLSIQGDAYSVPIDFADEAMLVSGMTFDEDSGILYFHSEGLQDLIDTEDVLETTTTKIIINVALKKSGFINKTISVSKEDIGRLFTTPIS